MNKLSANTHVQNIMWHGKSLGKTVITRNNEWTLFQKALTKA